MVDLSIVVCMFTRQYPSKKNGPTNGGFAGVSANGPPKIPWVSGCFKFQERSNDDLTHNREYPLVNIQKTMENHNF